MLLLDEDGPFELENELRGLEKVEAAGAEVEESPQSPPQLMVSVSRLT